MWMAARTVFTTGVFEVVRDFPEPLSGSAISCGIFSIDPHMLVPSEIFRACGSCHMWDFPGHQFDYFLVGLVSFPGVEDKSRLA